MKHGKGILEQIRESNRVYTTLTDEELEKVVKQFIEDLQKNYKVEKRIFVDSNTYRRYIGKKQHGQRPKK